jgi:hypothetical protein
MEEPNSCSKIGTGQKTCKGLDELIHFPISVHGQGDKETLQESVNKFTELFKSTNSAWISVLK